MKPSSKEYSSCSETLYHAVRLIASPREHTSFPGNIRPKFMSVHLQAFHRDQACPIKLFVNTPKTGTPWGKMGRGKTGTRLRRGLGAQMLRREHLRSRLNISAMTSLSRSFSLKPRRKYFLRGFSREGISNFHVRGMVAFFFEHGEF